MLAKIYMAKKLNPMSEDFICKELCKLDPSKSLGTDTIPSRFVTFQCSQNLFLHIIDLSVDQNFKK